MQTLLMARLLVTLFGAMAMTQQAAAQACATVDTMPDGSEYGLPADCTSLLAAGDLTCEDLACYAPSVQNPGQCGVQNPAGYAAQCSRTCGQNTYDGFYGEGACQTLIVSGTLTCEVNFAAGGQYQGYCDFACGFCSIDLPRDQSVPDWIWAR